ncbi:glycosyltransferase family 4 protein [Tenacibaculum finnmarkense]|uniref:Glycosyltransferase n=2 Tax=Tenacibaculum finnmarkense TaxID=2781243 RepID=A0AAP1WG38_9FLAO|nr:glycosyltransferase family 4 protein [Tenacibaculum finnmarkense]MBE7652737.1 glycosyltransferase [Tenacibaculum finnmarkense genomovar finnmarkense]MBE7694986.1 glycosyltransferase [Tenacibaculum finnmarkense genomovar finnmarkense]MCD8439261.1 glycosyltransferase family 4 protein [Tenacibaculum finnmarkense genomovar ulcerans]MCG8185844.1 glycosyltransferase family 4 protein [Tenacibaculum finnmarkense genomovar finnmarkense]MCG8720054.1 glycosyltransferase family 4 protein [Tenacibaculum
MNILFLTLVQIDSITDRGIYPDLLRKFCNEGHKVTIVTPVERRKKISTNLIKHENISILQVKTLNIQKTNILEKGLGTLLIESQYLSAIKKYLATEKYDLILYATPPITFEKVIRYVKKKNQAKTYLLLKDIFPQNAVDMKMIRKGGFVHRFFLKKERNLYEISDTIGCMSEANVDFVLKYNSEIDKNKVEVNPNTIEPIEIKYSDEEKYNIRSQYGIPLNKKIFVYGGNLGKPQGLGFLLETITRTKNQEVYFLIIGDGTEYQRISDWFKEQNPTNAKLLQRLPKSDYDKLLASCDVGLIFLDENFLIPNFPSRLLSYLEMKIPVLSATDCNTDIGDVIENAKCGYKVVAGNQDEMQQKISKLMNDDFNVLSENSYNLLLNEYLVERSYKLILNRM